MRTIPLVWGLAMCLAAGSALAATRVVTSTSDDVHDAGSLRHMIGMADPGDTITFDLQYPAVIALSDANPIPNLYIQKSLVIMGPGADRLAIHPAASYGGFDVFQPDVPTADVVVTISGLTVENSSQTGFYTDGFTGIPAYKTYLYLEDVVIANVFVGVSINTGGAIVSIVRTTIDGNNSGISASSAFVTVADTTLKNNLFAIGGNTSNITVVNSTIVGNAFEGSSAVDAGLNTAINLIFTTVAGSPISAGWGVRKSDPSAVITLKNSLLAGHFAGNCAPTSPVVSADYNLSDDASCSLAGAHDIDNVPSGLDPAGLSWNGGPTQTVWLLPSSPALNAIPIANCTDDTDTAITTDQRGATRPDAGACDIGAMESDRVFAANFD